MMMMQLHLHQQNVVVLSNVMQLTFWSLSSLLSPLYYLLDDDDNDDDDDDYVHVQPEVCLCSRQQVQDVSHRSQESR